MAADFVLVPIKPAWVDLDATKVMKEMIEAARYRNTHVEVRAVLNEYQPRTTIMAQALEIVNVMEIEMLRTKISQAQVLRQIQGYGEAIHSRSRTISCRQFRDVADEILEILGVPLTQKAA